jgi:5-methylcytosine-specific restriction endonuclease McrA
MVERRPVDTPHFLMSPVYNGDMKDLRKYADRRDELIRAVAKRRRKVKTLAIEYKGGKCQLCGYARYQGALDLHHIDPKEKDFGIGDKGYTRSWETVRKELDKCVLLCANCHRELEAGITQLPGVIRVENEVKSGKP